VRRAGDWRRGSGVTLTIGRGYWGPTINLISAVKPVLLTEHERGWTAEPHKLKPRQFGKMELHPKAIAESDLPVGARAAFKGSKSAIGRYDVAHIYEVMAVFVGRQFQGQGYGLAMYLKALELAASHKCWLVNDTRQATSPSAYATWRRLIGYAAKSLVGPPPPQKLFDYERQRWAMGYRPPGDRDRCGQPRAPGHGRLRTQRAWPQGPSADHRHDEQDLGSWAVGRHP
jgi:GNAT superfamily N-acetyltransferase